MSAADGMKISGAERAAAAWRWLSPLLVGLVAVGLMAFRLDRRSFWTDEAYNVLLVRQRWPDMIRVIGDHEPSQAVYLMLLKPWLALVGNDEWVTRAPSVVFGATAAALVVPLGTRLVSRRVGVVAGLLLACNAVFVEWSQYARTYSLAVLASVVTTLVFIRALETQKRRLWLVYGALGALSIFCHLFVGFVLVAQGLAALARDGRRALRPLAEAWVVIGVGLIPLAAYAVRGTRSPVEWIPRPGLADIWGSLHFASGRNVALLVAALAGAFVAARTIDRWIPTLLVAWIGVPIAGGVLVSLVHPVLVPRFLIVAAPAIALLGAIAIVRLPVSALVVALCLIAAGSAWRLVTIYDRPADDWARASRAAIAAHARGADVGVAPHFAWRELAIYAPGVPRVDGPTGKPLFLVLWASDHEQAEDLSRPFLAGAAYRLVSEKTVGDEIRLEEWRPR